MHGPPTSRHEAPDEGTLLRAIARLDEAGEAVSVVRLAERWAESRVLPVAVRVVEARAFLALLQVDRAWVRLKEALAEDPQCVDALALLVEVFVRRGWPTRAHEPLAELGRLAPEHPALERLRGAVAAPVAAPPENAREIERSGDPERMLPLVEHYLATGSVLRAQSLLERLRRGGAEDDPRVAALLWGIRGEYLDRPGSLQELVASFGVAPDPEEWSGADHTESLRLGADGAPATQEVGRGAAGRAGVSFPSLFRHAESGDPSLGDEDEVTMASVMAGSEELQDPPTHESLDDGLEGDGDPDSTQILDIIGAGGGGAAEDTPPADPLHRPLDLRRFQALQPEDPSEPDSWAGDEDGDLVVLTKREPVADAHSETASQGLVGVIEKVPVPPPLPEGLPGQDEDTPEVSPAVQAPVLAEPTSEEVAFDGGADRRRLGLAVGLGIALGGMLWAGVRYMESVAADGIVEEVHGAVMAADTSALEGLAHSLQEQIDKDAGPAGPLSAELALVEAVLYREHTGRPEQLERARTAAAAAASARGTPAEELALAMGALRWAEGDAAGALEALADADAGSPLRSRIATDIALQAGDPAAVSAAWIAPGTPSAAPWLASLAPGVAALEDGPEAAAQAASALSGLGDAALVPVLAEGWTGAAPAARLKAISALQQRAGSLPRQQAARLQAARALLLLELGRSGAETVAAEATKAAPASAEAWHAAGVLALYEGRVRKALDAFQACTAARPSGPSCERGEVQTLLELDRLDEAAARAQAPTLKAWVAAERGEEAAAEGPLAGYIAALSRVDGADAAAAAQAGEAAEALAGSGDPLDRLLAPRARALQLRLLGADAADADVRALLTSGRRDPHVAVHLAARAEAAGEPGRAARLLAEGALGAPESARVHHARGMLLFEPRTMDQARTAWRRYLDLGPSGPRAERVRERIGG